MKHTIKTITFAAMAALMIIGGCKKADPGPAGTDGTNGTNGIDGVNGVGFEEAVKYGGIFLKLQGKRPDGVSFTDTATFRFAPANKSFSGISGADGCDPTSTVKRYLVMDNNSEDDFVTSVFEQYSCDGNSNYFDLVVRKSVFFPNEHVYFNMNDEFSFSYYFEGDDLPLNPTDPGPDSNGQLVYSFDFVSVENSTGFDLHVTGTVSASVFTQINGGRVGARRSTTVPVQRAVMLPM